MSKGRLRDLSQSGALMLLTHPTEHGEEARLTMLPESDAEVAVRARVVRAAANGEESEVGVRFVGMDLPARRAIANLLLRRTAMKP